jgi:hypothetical protein
MKERVDSNHKTPQHKVTKCKTFYRSVLYLNNRERLDKEEVNQRTSKYRHLLVKEKENVHKSFPL